MKNRYLLAAVILLVAGVIVSVEAKPQNNRSIPQVVIHSSSAIAAYKPDLENYLKSVATKTDWQLGIDWARGDSGGVDCPTNYMATYPECIYKGGRSCLMTKAVDSAKANNCSWAFQLTLITQCHNGQAATSLANAGQQAVCDYEKSLP